MKIVIIGGVAAGMSAASKARRENPEAEIIVYEKGEYLSYAACGMPYYLSDVVEDSDKLLVRSKEKFEQNGIKVFTGHEVVLVDPHYKRLHIKDLDKKEVIMESYDKLLVATGADPVIPPFEGVKLKGIMTLKSFKDGLDMKDALNDSDVKQVTIVGGGYIGIEVAENLLQIGLKVRVVELLDRILMPFEKEISDFGYEALVKAGVEFNLGEKVMKFADVDGSGKVGRVVTDKGSYDTDLVVLSIGVRPNTGFLSDKGFEKMKNGALVVDRQMRTSVNDIYAAGDCATVYHFQKQDHAYFPLGTTANKCGKLAGVNLAGGHKEFIGAIGSAAIKILDLDLARTGLLESEAKELGYHAASKVVTTKNRPSYYIGSHPITFKIIYDHDTREILGAQAVGAGDVVLRIDMFAMAIFNRMRLDEFGMTDLCYAPPYSSAWDAVHVAVNAIK